MLPNCIIIGAQKCGTTSLHYYLDQHPQIQMSKWKEIQFFNEEYEWHRGPKWYAKHFKGNTKIHGESSTPYTNYPFYKGVPERMHSLIPNAKLIYLVRDPVARALSAYLYGFKGFDDKRSASEAFAVLENNEYVTRGKYFFQLQQFLKYFPKEQICVVQSEQLRAQRRESLKNIFQFLEVDEAFTCDAFFEEKTVNKEILQRPKTRKWIRMIIEEGKPFNFLFKMFSKEKQKRLKNFFIPKGVVIPKPEVSETLKKALQNFYREDVNLLRDFIGLSLEGWSV